MSDYEALNRIVGGLVARVDGLEKMMGSIDTKLDRIISLEDNRVGRKETIRGGLDAIKWGISMVCGGAALAVYQWIAQHWK